MHSARLSCYERRMKMARSVTPKSELETQSSCSLIQRKGGPRLRHFFEYKLRTVMICINRRCMRVAGRSQIRQTCRGAIGYAASAILFGNVWWIMTRIEEVKP